MSFLTTGTGSLAIWARSKDFDALLRVYDPDGTLVGEDDYDGGWTPVGDNDNAAVNVQLTKSGSYTIHLSASTGTYNGGQFETFLMPGGDYQFSWDGYVPAFVNGVTYITSSAVIALAEDWSDHILFYDLISKTLLASYTQSFGMAAAVYSPVQDRVFQLGAAADIYFNEYDRTGSFVTTHSLSASTMVFMNSIIYDSDKDQICIIDNGTGARKKFCIWDCGTKTIVTESRFTVSSSVGQQYGTYCSANQKYYISLGSSGDIETVDANTYETGSIGFRSNSWGIRYVPQIGRVVCGGTGTGTIGFINPLTNTRVISNIGSGWYFQSATYDPCSDRTVVGIVLANYGMGLLCYDSNLTASHFVPICNTDYTYAMDMCFANSGSRVIVARGDYSTNGVYSCKINTPTASIPYVEPAPPVPAAPSSFFVSSGSALLEWVDNSGGTATTAIQKSTDGVTFVDYATVGAGTSSYRDTNVTQSLSYWYKVGTFNASGTSSFASGSIYFAIRRPDPTTGSAGTETGYYSPWEFSTLNRRSVTLDAFDKTLTDTTSYPNYYQLVNCFQSMSIASGSRVTFDSSSVLAMDDTTPIPILKIDDDGQRPCVVMYHGTHGSERDAAHGLIRFLYDYINNSGSGANNDRVFNYFQDRYTLIVVGLLNAWGWINGDRRNINAIDINRNCQYGWAYLDSGDSGLAPNTEENKRVTDYLYSGSYLSRTLISVDSHGWGAYSQWWIGYLVSNMWYNMDVARTQRSHYLYYNNFLYQRLADDDYGDQGLTVRLSGSKGMFGVESRGTRKPYINNNAIEYTHPSCYRILVEHPQTFSAGTYPVVGSVGQPRAVNTITKYDTFYATLAAAADQYNLVSSSVSTFKDTPYMIPLNSNSLFKDWNEGAGRPDWTSYSKILLTQTQSTVDGLFTQMYYPSFSLWPDNIADMGYTLYSGSRGVYMMIAGGSVATTQSSDKAAFRIENLTTGEQKLVDSADVYGSALAMCTDNSSSIWKVGGYLSAGATYEDGIYVADFDDIVSGSSVTWTKKTTLVQGGLQRHTANYWVDPTNDQRYIVVAGGRTDENYTASVVKYRVDDDSYTPTVLTSELSGRRGYHVAAVSGSKLFIFGGISGSINYVGVRKIDLVSDTVAAGTNMPVTTSRAAICADPYDSDRVYIVLGAVGSTNNPNPSSASLLRYNMGSGGWTVIDYTLGPYFENDDSASYFSGLIRPAACAFGDSITIYCGASNSESFHSEVYDLDLDTYELNNRAADTSTYGYLKLSNNDTTGIFLNTVPGDVFTAVATMRRSAKTPKGTNDPILRLVMKSGLSGTDYWRMVYTQQFVPADEWTTYSMPFVITSSTETRMQAPYIRTYSKGTSVDIKAFQVFKGDPGAMYSIAGQMGSASLSCSRQFTSSLTTGTQYDRTIRFEPFFGAQSAANKHLISFNFSASSQLQYLILNYSSSISKSLSPQTVEYATYYYPNPTGQFRLMGSGSGGTFTQSFLINSELNYDNQRLTNGAYRRDPVALKLETTTGSALLAHMWFLGTYETASLTTQSVAITGFNTLGSGLLLYDDV